MLKLFQAIDRNGERYLLLVFYTIIVLAVTSEVIRRFVLNYSSIWGEEVARFAFIYLAWVGASAGVRHRNHLRIDLIMNILPTRAKGGLYLFGDFATLVLAVFAIWLSMGPILTSLRFDSVTAGLRISEAWFLAAVPLGFSLMVFRLLQAMVRDWADLRHGRPAYEGRKLFG